MYCDEKHLSDREFIEMQIRESCPPPAKLDRNQTQLYLHCRNGWGVLLMHVRVQKWGNSLALRIPKPLARDAEVTEGTLLNLAVSEGKVVATPVEQKKLSLRELLAKVNKKNLHGEADFGGPAGREIW